MISRASRLLEITNRICPRGLIALSSGLTQFFENSTEFATSQPDGRRGSAALPASVAKVFVHFLRYKHVLPSRLQIRLLLQSVHPAFKPRSIPNVLHLNSVLFCMVTNGNHSTLPERNATDDLRSEASSSHPQCLCQTGLLGSIVSNSWSTTHPHEYLLR